MIKLENVVLASPEQMEFIIEGMRNPMNSWEKSDSGYSNLCEKFITGDRDVQLMQRLSNAGTEHRKYMRMMPVYVRITAPLYWWKEFDTYKVGTVANSCSTMHKIQAKEFTLEDFSTEHLYTEEDVNHIDMLGWLQEQIDILNVWRRTYLDVKDSKVSATSAKKYWWQMIQLLPSSYNQTRNVMLNYEVLANIYRQRHSHKLDEWREFCKWIESLPYSELIIGFKEYDTVEYAKEHPDFADRIREIAEKRLPYPWTAEDSTFCDKCEHLHDCSNKGGIAEVRTGVDIAKTQFGFCHYINKPGYDCPNKVRVSNTRGSDLWQPGDED